MIQHNFNLFVHFQPFPDPMADPNMGFSACFINTLDDHNQEDDQEEAGDFFAYSKARGSKKEDESEMHKSFRRLSGFPRADDSEFLIHVDTSVTLSVNKIVVRNSEFHAVCSLCLPNICLNFSGCDNVFGLSRSFERRR